MPSKLYHYKITVNGEFEDWSKKSWWYIESMEVVLDKYRRAVEPRAFSQLGIGYTNISNFTKVK